MAALTTLHVDQQLLSKQQIGASCKGALSAFGTVPFLTNTTVASAGTNAGLQNAVTAAIPTRHADERFLAVRINLGITLGKYSTELSDTRISSVSTGSALVGLTFADPNVVQGANYPPE